MAFGKISKVKAGIGIAAFVVVAGGAVSTFALNGGFNDSQNANNVEQALNSPKPSTDVADSVQAPAVTDTANDTSDPSASQQQNTTPDNTPTAPTAPVVPTYANTYPSDWRTQCNTSVDTWSMNKCEASSYAAFKVNEAFGYSLNHWGSVASWPSVADSKSVPRGTNPQVHSVGIMGNFAVWVEAINSDGTLNVTFYNFAGTSKYGTSSANDFGTWLNVPANVFSTYIYFS